MGWLAGIAWKELAGNLLGGAWSGVKGVGKWLGSLDLVHLLLLGVALFAGWQTVGRWSQHRYTVKVEGQLAKCAQGRADDAARYAKAQADAAAANKARVEAENHLREHINETSHNSFSADRDRLRAQSGADPRAPGAAGIPAIPHAAEGTPAEVVSLPPAELLRAQETELQLNALIDWLLKQEAVDPNKEPKP